MNGLPDSKRRYVKSAVYFGQGEFLKKRCAGRWIQKPFLMSDVAIVLGNLCRKDVEVIRPKKIVAVPYGIDLAVMKSPVRENKLVFRILFVGLHIESKGILDLLDTAAALRNLGVSFCIHTVGPWKSDRIRNVFERKQRELGLEGVVVPLGEITGDKLWLEYAEAELFFFPTFFEFETFGLVVVEAMAYGLPIVSSDWRGPGDVVRDGETGFICPAHDIQAYAVAIEKILSDSELRDSMGQAARVIYEKHYRRGIFIDSIESTFRALM